MENGILIIAALWGILNIILFFKLWGMCDNVSKMLRIMIMSYNKSVDEKGASNKQQIQRSNEKRDTLDDDGKIGELAEKAGNMITKIFGGGKD